MAMEMDHSFTVPVAPDRAWDVLLDVERIAPCMPGATVEEFDGEVVTGRIKVKVGPVSLTYRGTAKFTERNPDTKNIVLEASGKETRGAGTASATVQAWLEPESSGEATKVSMHTTMNVTGRPAQFGRGVIVEVGGKLVEQFAQNLRQQIIGDSAASADAPAEEAPAEAAGAAGTGTETAVTASAGTAVAETAAVGAESASAGTEAAAAAGPAGTAAAGTASAPTATADDGAEADASAGQPSVTTDDRTRTITPPVTAPVASTAPAPPAAAAADSINLIRLVGPSILKRVVPVAAGLAALALLGRRFRHVFRRGTKK
jgi:carbon monoxide dehydrogenase subunit G